LTIHNIGYQGVFSEAVLPGLNLGGERHLLDANDLSHGIVNFLRTGLKWADALATVSRTYAKEIQTPELGMGLDEVLRRRGKVLTGIVNGVDYGDWDPATDPLISANYTATDLSGKAEVKRDLLADFGLSGDERVPLLGIVSRMTGQKGFDLLPEALGALFPQRSFQLVVLGSGERELESFFQRLRDAHPDRVAVFRGHDNVLAHRIEAAADMFLMPSRYEPCGLNQMYSLKYGTVPIVRRTGGLADTVEPFDPATGTGTGFLFDAFTPAALYEAMTAALTLFEDRGSWTTLMRNGMARDYSWERQGPEYEALYRAIVARPRRPD
jgi:starch synthase